MSYTLNVKRMLSGTAVLLGAALLGGCENISLLNPAGEVGVNARNLILTAFGLMLLVVIPVIFMTFWFAWKYRASNKSATYTPDWEHSTKIEIVVWTIPCIIIAILAALTWKSTHDLDPKKPIVSTEKAIQINVVAMDWKWLFIYPEQGIATVNELNFPVDVPVEFHVTSASAMNSFFIPDLGSQIYAMAGMDNKLNLIANRPGTFYGLSANYSGAGFSGMNFKATAGTRKEFDAWVAKVKASPTKLDANSYNELVKPSEKHPVQYFATFKPNLFVDILQGAKSGAPVTDTATKAVALPDVKKTNEHAGMDMSGSHAGMKMPPAQ